VLRDVSGDRDALARRLHTVAHVGVPNYFGIQRFGREGSNLVSAARFAAGEGLPRGREPRAFVLSAARSLMFNAVLARRVAQGSWNGLLPGELVNLAGRGSWFASEAIDEVLLERLARYDIHGTGPLPGRGVVPVGEAGALEADVLAEFAPLIAALESEGVESARRPLRLVPGEFESTLEGDTLSLSFTLPSGAYATALVRELVASDDLPQESTDD
jgi:tRNA pseudouridine13 synthase